MILVLDEGNTRTKFGIFEGSRLIRKGYAELQALAQEWPTESFSAAIRCSVAEKPEHYEMWLGQVPIYEVSHRLPLPFSMAYQSPETLGADRIAAVAGAQYFLPRKHVLVIDAGTCITYDLLEAAQIYRGGIIAPGLRMRLQAMHYFTGRLPLLQENEEAPLTGTTTAECMQSGAINGVLAEAEGIIQRHKANYPGLHIMVSGGNMALFESKLKARLFAQPDLVLYGLHALLRYQLPPV